MELEDAVLILEYVLESAQINNINCGQNIAPTHTNNPHITKANKHTFSHLQVLLRLIHKIVNRL
jgi:hypothetical protein